MKNFILGNNNCLLATWTKEGATVESIEHEYLANGLICVPPLKEQQAINEYIEDTARKTDCAVELQKQQIEKLKEYKTTLINSAVTGKIKVPGVIEG